MNTLDNILTNVKWFFSPVWTFELRQSLQDIDILYDDFQNAELVSTFVNNQDAGTVESYTVSNLEIGKSVEIL